MFETVLKHALPIVVGLLYANQILAAEPTTEAQTVPPAATQMKDAVNVVGQGPLGFAKAKPKAKSKAKPRGLAIDINSANKRDLMQLPGVDADTADRIIANRPYHTRSGLVMKGVMSMDDFQRIRKHVIFIRPD